MRRWRFFILLVVLAGGMAALYAAARTDFLPDRYNPLAPLNLAEEPNSVTDWKLWLMADDLSACIAALRRAGVEVEPMPPQSERPDCTREGTVKIAKLSSAVIGDEEMRCDVAMRLYLLERHVMQPSVRRHLGSGIVRLTHFGSYSCRNIAGSGRLSEHATANAFDLSGFVLADGRSVTLKTGWFQGGAAAAFLRDVRLGACSLFNMVLSPDYNEAHADHFHFDMGFFRGCN
jgi:hypothetical protein